MSSILRFLTLLCTLITATSSPSLFVLGSSNVDIFAPTQSESVWPTPGENLLLPGPSCIKPGGKGLNQACALATLSSSLPTTFITCLPKSSPLSSVLLSALKSSKVTPILLEPVTSEHPGLGLVFPQTSDVSAIVLPNSNLDFPPTIETDLKSLKMCKLLLLQMEIPWRVNKMALDLIDDECVSILDLGGSFSPLPPTLKLTFLTMNHSEMLRLLTSLNYTFKDNFTEAANFIRSQFPNVNYVIITRSENGLILSSSSRTTTIPSPKINYVDGTGSGDNFRAGLGSKLIELEELDHESVVEACEYASMVGAKTCEILGAGCPDPLTLRGGGVEEDCERLGFGSRLNSMKDLPSLSPFTNDLEGWINRQGTIKGLTLIDFNYPQHLNPSTNLKKIEKLLQKNKLKTGAVCLRYPKKFVGGAFTNVDASLRREVRIDTARSERRQRGAKRRTK
ncbi:hypothetical protein TL16_g01874 [Triparma laevis f. inornata]|uniref:Carbohydrate kinase PfkB domain-containing protein n=1 Tax=Triparma laevis f. inornata TaxID=1714386 RepID=A0A9W6ZST4_9STRA|nr:hypothetical protein TL16_g01874 [Triparma laevis f. inornata]